MDREIKFRAWDKEKNSMHRVEEISFEKNGILHGLLENAGGRLYLNKRVLVEDKWINDVVLMQYTGLKDKNGKEIFEGDIVFAEARLDCAKMVVVWDNGKFVLVPCERYKNYISGCGYKEIKWLEKEVIGNIYENPDLLEG